MNFLKVAGRDISSIFKNRFIRVSVTAIIIVPLLYSLLYLYAFWDPYSRLDKMPVAIVNLDKGGINDGNEVNYGKDMVEKLKENNKVGWRFVTLEDAKQGVEGKKYYAMFVVPEDFTNKALSAKESNPIKPEILYTANEKRNFLAAQINGKVLVELKAELAKNISKEYTKVTFDNLYELKDGMNKAADGSTELKNGIVDARDGANKLKDGLHQLNSSAPALSDGTDKLFNGSKDLVGGAGQLKDGSSYLAGKLKDAEYGSSKLKEGSIGLYKGLGSVVSGLGELNKGLNTTARDGSGKPLGLKVGAGDLYNGISILNSSINTDKLDAEGKPLGLKNGVTAVDAGINQLISSMEKSKDDLNSTSIFLMQYIGAHPEAMADPNMQQFLAGLNNIKINSENPENLKQIEALKSGSASLVAGVGNLSNAVKYQILPGSKSVSDGVSMVSSVINDQILPGTNKLKEGSNSLQGGLTQLNDGLKLATFGSSSLADGSSKLYDGSLLLSNGLLTMKGNLPSLLDGTKQLYDGSTALSDGMNKLADGAQELSGKLGEGAVKLNRNLVSDSNTMSEFVSEPLTMNEKPINPVKNYGTGFAPYFIPLSLWVGALMMFFVITDKVDDDINASPAAVVLGKFLSYGYIGIIQAVLASVIVIVLGLKPDNVPLYFAFNILMAFVFIAIIQCLVFLMGQVGRLLAIILLILQLTSCAGTFPLEVVPKFFRVLNPMMPFTYCVSALREVISGVDYSVLGRDALILVVVMAAFLFASVLLKGHADKVQDMVREKKQAIEIA